MKANELMIGDWVLCDGKAYRVAEIGGIVCIDNERELFAEPDQLQPIPLTPEILEKNGFESDNNVFGLCDYKLSESYILENRGDRFSFVKRIPNYRSTFHMTDISYVHELQHALRLCGIEKDLTI